jgi:hypothetical protein
MARQRLSIKNSIYQGGYGGTSSGLTVKDGRLINNRPDSQTGIAEMAKMRAEAKRQAKIDMIAEGYARGEARAEMEKSVYKDFLY